MLEKLGFRPLVEQTLTVNRLTRVMDLYQFVLAIMMGLYVGFSRLNQLRFIALDPLLTGILHVAQLPPAVHLVALPGFVAPVDRRNPMMS